MRNKRTALFSLTLVFVILLSLTVSAFLPGEELEETTRSVAAVIDQSSPGKPVEVMCDLTGITVTVSADALPENITSVFFQTMTLVKEFEQAAINTITSAVTAAVASPATAKVSRQSQQIVKNYNIAPVSVLAINLVGRSSNGKTQNITVLKKPIEITVPVPRGVNGVAYIHPTTKELVILEGRVRNGFMTFTKDILGVELILVSLTKK